MSETPVTNFDIIFISYDEDNADKNWADLQKKCPWAKRVHGVYGSDAAHKAAAQLSSTDRFTTCDADTIVKPEFFNLTIPNWAFQNNWQSKSHYRVKKSDYVPGKNSTQQACCHTSYIEKLPPSLEPATLL